MRDPLPDTEDRPLSDRSVAGRWPSRQVLLILVGIVAAEVVVLLFVFGIGNDPVVAGDGPIYARLGHNLAEHGAHSAAETSPFDADVFRTPGYPAFLAALYLVSGGSELAVRAAQVLLIGATAVLVGQIARHYFGPRVATAASLVCVLYAPLVLFSVLHLTEVLATFLLTLGVWTLVRGQAAENPRAFVGWCGGAIVAFACLVTVRPSALSTFGCVLVAAISWRGQPRTRRVWAASVAVLCLGVLLAPWSMRNYELTGRFLPFGAGSGTSLYASAEQYAGAVPYVLGAEDFETIYMHIGQRLKESERRIAAEDVAHPTSAIQVDLDDRLKADARDRFSTIGPWDVIESLPTRVAALWSPGSITVTLPQKGQGTVRLLAQVQHLGLLLMALGGAYLYRRRLWELWPIYSSAIALTLVHLVFHVEPRYLLPARPLFFILAAACGVRIFDRLQGARSESPALDATVSASAQ